LIGTQGEYVEWSQTADQYFDGGAAQTIWLRVYLEGTPDLQFYFFDAYADADNRIGMAVTTGGNGRYYQDDSGAEDSAYGDITATTWIDIAYTLDPANADHAAWEGSWDEDLNEIGAMAESIIEYNLGDSGNWYRADGSQPSNQIYVTQWALVDGYKAGVPW